MSNAALRVALSAGNLATRLAAITTGPSARTLPANVKSLNIRYKGLKGNAAAKKMCGELLPALRYSNPTVLVTIASPPSKTAVAAVVGEGEISSLESWKEMPGISIAFHDETKSIFFPLAGNVKSTKLIERFWSSMDSEEVMMKYSSGQVIPDEVEEVEIKI